MHQTGWVISSSIHPSVEEARALLATLLPVRASGRLPLDQAYGRVLAHDLIALVAHPSATESAMDGVACRAADTSGATRDVPVQLRLMGASWAGDGYAGILAPGQATRIATGGMLPIGADAICPLEELRVLGETVELFRPASSRDVRREGSDFRPGDRLLQAGDTLSPSKAAVAAAMGHVTVPVQPTLRVGLLSTGSEIRPVGEALRPGEVYNSNIFGLTGLLQADGHHVISLGHVPDTVDALETACAQASGVDVIITSGGASVGQRDVVRILLTQHGDLMLPGVRMRPGKAMLAGRYRDTPLIGLPGNPVASLVAYEVVVRPILSGRPPPVWSLRTGSAFRSLATQTGFWRGAVRDGLVFDQKEQGAGALRSLAESDVLVIIPEGHPGTIGSLVNVIPVR